MMAKKDQEPTAPDRHRVAPSPHISDTGFTTQRMMLDVTIALLPAAAMGIIIFGWRGLLQMVICIVACAGTEAVCAKLRSRPVTLTDGSAILTGLILGMSLPANAPWFIGVVGSVVAIGLTKALFGGLGYNIFNPAMTGRAFVLLSFAGLMGASAYQVRDSGIDAMTQATPLAMAKEAVVTVPDLWPLFIGRINGSVGEVSALALLIGGLYICWRRSASWEIPAGTLLSVFVLAGIAWLTGVTPLSPLHHLCSGALMFGAFFIATDPVTSPLTPKGKWIFGIGVGALTVLMRLFSSYTEGLMFAILLMNAAVPLINRWTVPRPLGGPTPQPA